MTKRMYYYRVGIGYAGVSLEYHLLRAQNELDARRYAIGAWLHPDKGFDHVSATRIPKAKAAQYSGFFTCPTADHYEEV